MSVRWCWHEQTDKNITFDIFFSVSQTQLKFCAGLFSKGDRWVINLKAKNKKNEKNVKTGKILINRKLLKNLTEILFENNGKVIKKQKIH